MAKTCRTCRVLVPWLRCPKQHAFMQSYQVMECYELRETPLLVDALVEALKAMLTLPYRPLRSSPQQASRIDAIEVNAKAAVSRYKEEVSDA